MGIYDGRSDRRRLAGFLSGIKLTNDAVHVISDCVTSYDLKKMPEMLVYYSDKGCEIRTLEEY